MLSYTGGLSSQQQAKERKRKSQDVQRLYEEDFRRTMKNLAAAIKGAQGNVKTELERLRVKCLEEREAISAEAEAEFEEALARLRKGRDEVAKLRRAEHKDVIAAMRREIDAIRKRIKDERRAWPEIWKGYTIEAREAFERFVRDARAKRDEKVRVARAQCMQRGTTALKEAQEALLKLTEEKAERLGDKRFKKQYEASGKGPRAKKQAATSEEQKRSQRLEREYDAAQRKERQSVSRQRAKERAAESDDEVRSNLEAIDPRLVSLFEMFGRKVKGTDRKSRTEAFVEMYEEDKANMDAALWQAEEEATNRFLEQQYREHKEKEREKERKERQAKAKRSQASFGTSSGADLVGDPRQLVIGQPPPPKRKKAVASLDPFETSDPPF